MLDSRPPGFPNLDSMHLGFLASLTMALLCGCSESPPAVTRETKPEDLPAPEPLATLRAEEIARGLQIVW